MRIGACHEFPRSNPLPLPCWNGMALKPKPKRSVLRAGYNSLCLLVRASPNPHLRVYITSKDKGVVNTLSEIRGFTKVKVGIVAGFHLEDEAWIDIDLLHFLICQLYIAFNEGWRCLFPQPRTYKRKVQVSSLLVRDTVRLFICCLMPHFSKSFIKSLPS